MWVELSLLVLWVGTLLALVDCRRLWRGQPNRVEKGFALAGFSRGRVEAAPVMFAAGMLFWTGGWILLVLDPHTGHSDYTLPQIIGVLLGLLGMIVGALAACVARLSRPQWLVPPHLRDQS